MINVALCAYGFSGKIFHQPFIHAHPGFHLQGVLERTKNESAADNPGIRIYRSLDELLADPAIDLVVVNTPNYLHFEYASKALHAGKHVIVEKPFTATVAEAQHLLEMARQAGKFITVYHNRRYDSDFLTLKKVVEGGALGEFIEAEFRFDRYKPSLGVKRFKEEAFAGSGYVYDLGSHLADQAVAIFGKPQSLFADCRKVRPGTAVDDFFEIILYYSDNKRVRLLSGQVLRHPMPAYSIHGSLGSFIMERNDQQEALLVSGMLPVGRDWAKSPGAVNGLLVTESSTGPVTRTIESCTGNYMDYYQAVYERIVFNKTFPISDDEILTVISILEASSRSNETRQVTGLP